MTTPAQAPTHLHTTDDESLVIVEDVFDDEDDDEVDKAAPTSPSPASQELGFAASLCMDAGVEMVAPSDACDLRGAGRGGWLWLTSGHHRQEAAALPSCKDWSQYQGG
jgi:hypothetical protein